MPDSDWLQPNKHGYGKNLKQAVYGLAEKLKGRGAKVFIALLPQEGGYKIGFDDYLCKHSVDDFKKLPCTSFDDFDDSLKDIFENAIPEYSYPFEIFPERLQEVIKNYSEALSVEPEIIAHNMLVFASAAIGNSTRIESKSSHVEPLFLWGALIQPTGLGKTHAINALMKPIEYKQAVAYQAYQEDLRKYKQYQDKLKEDKRKKRKCEGNLVEGNPDGIIGMEVPVFRQYIINDSTIEANSDVSINQPRGVLLHNDELSSLPLGFGKYKKSEGTDKQHYLEIFNANPITINRVIAGVKYVPNTGMAIIGGIPTRIVTITFSEDDIHNGLLPRFLPVLVDDKLPYNNKTLSEDAKNSWSSIINKCYGIPLNLDNKTGRVKPLILHLNDEAFGLYVSFRWEYDQLLELLPERTRAFIPKLQTYCLRLAAILHILKTVDVNKDINANTVIDAEIMKDAIKSIRYYTHQVDKLVRLYSPKEELEPHQKRLIDTLYKLRGEVKDGRLYLKRITEIYNQGLPEHLILKGKHIGTILRNELRLKTDISHNSYLIWDDEMLKKHFRKSSKSSKLSKETYQQTEGVSIKEETHSSQHPETQDTEDKKQPFWNEQEIQEVEFIEEVKTNV